MNALITCILSLLIIQATSANSPILENSVLLYSANPTCEDVQGDGVIACSDDCKSRRYCLNFQEVSINCYAQTGRTYCDPTTLLCLSTPTVCDNVTPDLPDFKCPLVPGLYPYALNCSKFWSCGKKADLLECKNSVFDPLNKKCSPGIPCYTFSPVNGLCKGHNGTIVTHPLNRAVYAHCSGSFPTVRECPENHVFNTGKLTCDFVCKKVGNFAHPTDSACFYSCIKSYNTLIAESDCCKDGMKFNETIAACTP